MTAGPVNRALLESNYQNPGDIYSDLKTEGALDVVADAIDNNWNYLAGLVNAGTLVPYPALMSRQAIINGNFDVWQRNIVSTPANDTATYTADRWKQTVFAGTGGTLPSLSVDRQQLTSGDIPGSFYAYRITVDGPGTSLGPDSLYITEQTIENGTSLLCGSERKVTVSFYAKSTIPGKRLAVTINQNYGTGGSPSPQEIIQGTTLSISSTWARYSVTFTTNTLTGKTFGTNNNDYLSARIWSMWGSNLAGEVGTGTAETFVGAGEISITQVQVASSDVALPFQPRSFSEELSLCQRYYEKSAEYNVYSFAGAYPASEVVSSLSIDRLSKQDVRFKVKKRIAPTVVVYSSQTGAANFTMEINNSAAYVADRAVAVIEHSQASFALLGTAGTFTVGNFQKFQWTADAEI